MNKPLHSEKIARYVTLGLLITGVVSLAVPLLAAIERFVFDFWQIGPLAFAPLAGFLFLQVPVIFIYYSTANIVGVIFLGLQLDRFLISRYFSKRVGLLAGLATGGLVAGIGTALFLIISPLGIRPAGSLWIMFAMIWLIELTAFGWLGKVFSKHASRPGLLLGMSDHRKRLITLAGLSLSMLLLGALILGRVQASVVKDAVQSTINDYCTEEYEILLVSPAGVSPIGLMVLYPSTTWRVDCVTGISDQPIVRVNLLTCEINALYFTGMRSYKLKNCPLGVLSDSWSGGSAEDRPGENYP